MALQDILKAITAEADQKITSERSAHQKRLSTMREQSEQRISKRKQEIAMQKEEKRQQMRAKSEAHAQMIERNAELKKKQELLDTLFTLVTKKLGSCSEDKAEALLKQCIKSIKSKGTIHPSKAHANLLKKIAPSEQFEMGDAVEATGGFVFSSDKEERDFTFEHLVSQYLRPRTEVETASELFNA